MGATFNNTFDVPVSQSSWALDPQDNFLTRTRTDLPSPSFDDGVGKDVGLITSGAAGELQNNYFFYTDTLYSVAYNTNASEALKPAALYARKHMLTTPKSFSPWRNVFKTADKGQWNKGDFNSASMTLVPEPYAGEALWQAGPLAGRVVNIEGTASFVLDPSEPWWNDYSDFKYELKLVAKDYSIVPEFRISEHVEEYINYGIINTNLSGTFEIPGTKLSSSESTFYKDYSNSEFMKDFRYIPEETGLPPKEIRLVMSAAIR